MARPIRHPKIRVEHQDAFRQKLDKPRIYMSAWSENGNTQYVSNELDAADLIRLIRDAALALAQLNAVSRRDLP